MSTLPTNPPLPTGSQPIIQINDGQIQDHLNELVRTTVEQNLNHLLDAEADALCQAKLGNATKNELVIEQDIMNANWKPKQVK